MADGFNATEGSGKTIATDEIASKHYQRIKLIHGADGVNDGDISNANPLPVKILSGGEASYDALTTKAYGFFTASHQAIGLIDSGSAREVTIWNDTDANMIGSWDSGTTDHFIVPARSEKTVSWAALGEAESTDLQMKYASAPTTGSVYFEVIK